MATIRDLNWQDYYPPGVEPAWELALLFPPQGGWCIGDYFDLTERTHQLVEYTDGRIEVLAMPTAYHQRIVLFLINALQAVIHRGECGEVLMAPLPTILGPDKVREPDIVFKFRKNVVANTGDYFDGADLIIEVVSPDRESRRRDYETKRADYAQGGIPEYWIVDPEKSKITDLTLDGDKYVEHGVFSEGQQATSKLLDGFVVDVAAVFAAAKV